MFAPGLPMILAFVVLLVILLVFMGLGLWVVVRSLRGLSSGGWRALSERYAAELPADAERVFTRETIQVGAVRAKGCATAVVSPRGLGLRSPWSGGMLIPWSDIHPAGETTLYWRKAHELAVGEPRVATLTVFQELFDAMRPHLSARRAAAPSAPSVIGSR